MDGHVAYSQVFDAYLANLGNCVNRDMIDKAAMDFCVDLNNRPNRKKLTNFLFSVHRNRQDLIPFYSRLVVSSQIYFTFEIL